MPDEEVEGQYWLQRFGGHACLTIDLSTVVIPFALPPLIDSLHCNLSARCSVSGSRQSLCYAAYAMLRMLCCICYAACPMLRSIRLAGSRTHIQLTAISIFDNLMMTDS